MNESLIMSETILDLAKSCSWQQLALHPLVQQKHHHCVECNHWSVRPQYVRRHMISQHPEYGALIQECVEAIKHSRLSLQKPCQFCHQMYQRADAHLRSCMGIFQGVYLHRRLARGRTHQPVSQGTPRLHDVWPGTQRADGTPRGDQGVGPSKDPCDTGRTIQCTFEGKRLPLDDRPTKWSKQDQKGSQARAGDRTTAGQTLPGTRVGEDLGEHRAGCSRDACSTRRRRIRRCTL